MEKKLTDFVESKTNNKNINLTDSEYPHLLKKIKNPPKILYTNGNLSLLDKSAVAIIGTRKPSKEGRLATIEVAKEYSNKGFVIVSGLAQGVDSIAIKAALEAGASVVGVLPSPLENIVPKKNKELSKQLVENNGLLITEYPEGTKTQKYHYIKRNRIISGISMAVIIIESAAKGGTMHTANFAKEQNRPIIVIDLPAEGNQILKKELYPTIQIGKSRILL